MGAQALCVYLCLCLSAPVAASGGLYVLVPETGETGTQGQVLGRQCLSLVAGETRIARMSVCACI